MFRRGYARAVTLFALSPLIGEVLFGDVPLSLLPFGLLGLVPLPSKWMIRFGEPIDLGKRFAVEDAADPVLVDRLTEEVRETIQDMVDRALQERGPAFF